ncbi:uncharacterized protein LOC129298014 isoform X1 [Prosopis cineraria]|uniref:uncharacterized protein LOC129298014 isoform X1 n=2 Tax=Prosopis cineraria TaxID=364024 RepID=UPI00240EAE46|nr:uncharacterized protein LOC129298014 isoform X1 [Prosopis cineraria]XP_054792368.1 uncharacterized protein LOC129298014 isoform X1 [Prosopis cineraria]XP_054792369.1 uncharacterized protein LOC129298014 isoform X1 [Prosopis cineraria]XP_054792370.1 uncharacterized protein LOC129298014 isoform X1 [Prosopis cineraria]XP_054792371.1 uncharacterized protein LOC129298014 isoform X1 [Prosopis cineraria]XP_054792372.1 uncharacterized protein LOC129298014 isoform X1 [Prosopis cineraria]XP_05479237
MSKQPNILFLEEWLRNKCGGASKLNPRNSNSPSARAIIQAWADLRDSAKYESFTLHHLQSLKILVNSQTSVHVADPQAKLLVAILSSPNHSLPYESYPLMFRLLYIWVRKTLKPTSAIIDSVVEVLSHLISVQFDSRKDPFFFSEVILLLGAISSVLSSPERSKTTCLDILSGLLIKEYQFLGLFTELVPDVLAGIGYALSSPATVYNISILDSLFEIWGEENGPQGSISQGLMILYLFDWVMSNLVNFQFWDKIHLFCQEAFQKFKVNYAPFAVFMAGAGVVTASKRSMSSTIKSDTISKARTCAIVSMETLASNLFSRMLRSDMSISGNDLRDRLLLQCVSLALARTGSFSGHSSFFVCLALALLTEILPLPCMCKTALDLSRGSGGLKLTEINEHLDNILFKEAGAITGIFCNQYVSADEEHKDVVENLIWKYCQDLYFGYRQVALFFKGKEDKHLEGLGKIAESAFLMIVVFTLAVTKHKLNSKFTQEMQMDVSLKILVSFSCVEYFRHVRLPEYIEIIRKVVANVKENEHFCTSFVKSMPSYVELTNSPEFTLDQKTKYIWSKDEVQTARILFYLRVIPTCVEHLPSHVFRNMVVPTMFLYMEHPNGKVARASHSLFMAFISFGEESEMNGRLSLKEQLVFYYIERSLLGYPGITPFEGMASGVIGIVRHLPAGSPSIFYCINNLVEKADMLCAEVLTNDADAWKKLQGETEPCKRLLDLLLHIVFLVDIQVLVDLMKLLAQLITKLPQDAQNMVLNELYSQVAECDDVVRKPTLVSWLQSLSYLCKKASQENEVSAKTPSEDNFILACAADPSSWFKLASRL